MLFMAHLCCEIKSVAVSEASWWLTIVPVGLWEKIGVTRKYPCMHRESSI